MESCSQVSRTVWTDLLSGAQKNPQIQDIPQTFIVHPRTLGHKGLQGSPFPARAAAQHSFPPTWAGEEVES